MGCFGEEIKILAQRLLAMEERGLSKLNKRLIEGGKIILDTFAEHNFCYELIQHNPSSIPILYEPNEFEGKTLNRPPDFVIQKGDITPWRCSGEIILALPFFGREDLSARQTYLFLHQ